MLDLKTKRLYNRWAKMHQRCESPCHPKWKDYGARGITICVRWSGEQGFKNFVEDMGYPPPGLSLDRENNELGYFPENCRWATPKQQSMNRRIVKTGISAQARAVGLHPDVLRQRLYAGHSLENALAGAVRKHRAVPLGLTKSVICHRLKSGWFEAEAYAEPVRGYTT